VLKEFTPRTKEQHYQLQPRVEAIYSRLEYNKLQKNVAEC